MSCHHNPDLPDCPCIDAAEEGPTFEPDLADREADRWERTE
jgi:hypothetical protein